MFRGDLRYATGYCFLFPAKHSPPHQAAGVLILFLVRGSQKIRIMPFVFTREEDAQIACGIDILCKAQENPDYPLFTHCEFDPSFLLTLNAGLIPFGLITILPQEHCINQVQFYNGQNPIVVVKVHYGYNREDSLVTNHASIDHGLFRSMHFHTFVFETDDDENCSSNASSSRLRVDFGKPQPGNLKVADKLDTSGPSFIASDLYSGDILIEKVVSQPSDANFSQKL